MTTLTPWYVTDDHYVREMSSDAIVAVASDGGHLGGEVLIPANVMAENAEFIVRACNSHYDLIAALRDSTAVLGGIPAAKNNQRAADAIHAARAVIAKAEGR